MNLKAFKLIYVFISCLNIVSEVIFEFISIR
jgi:hypothetical protein